jgi:hypothetical protein
MSTFSVCAHHILFKIAFSVLLVIKAIQYASTHLLSTWITTFNQMHSELLIQTLFQTINSILLFMKDAYDTCDMFVNMKLQSFIGTLNKHTQIIARNLVYNLITLDALLQLFKVLFWNTYLIN